MSKTNSKSTTNKSEHQIIRDKLIQSSGYKGQLPDENINSEIKHTKQVPFEGSVYHNLGYSLSTKQINKKYDKSLLSVWSIIFWSLLKPLLKLTKK